MMKTKICASHLYSFLSTQTPGCRAGPRSSEQLSRAVAPSRLSCASCRRRAQGTPRRLPPGGSKAGVLVPKSCSSRPSLRAAGGPGACGLGDHGRSIGVRPLRSPLSGPFTHLSTQHPSHRALSFPSISVSRIFRPSSTLMQNATHDIIFQFKRKTRTEFLRKDVNED